MDQAIDGGQVATSVGVSVGELLRASALLRSISREELRSLALRVRRHSYAPNEMIFRRDDEGTGMMVVVSGRVKIVSVAPSGGEVLLNIMDPGEVFGEMTLLDGKPRSADAIAAVRTDVITLYRRDFLPILDRNPEAARRMMEILCDRIRRSTAFVEDAVFLDVPSRLLRKLQTLAENYGTELDDGAGIRIDHGLSQQEIGDSVGLTRVSINKQLGSWRQLGLIEDGRGYIIITDLQALKAAVVGA